MLDVYAVSCCNIAKQRSGKSSVTLCTAGHIGFLGRAGVFLFVGVLFFRLIADPSLNNSDETTIGNGLAQLQKNRGGRACLFILGFFLIIYGTFAVCFCLHTPIFCTLPLLPQTVQQDID